MLRDIQVRSTGELITDELNASEDTREEATVARTLGRSESGRTGGGTGTRQGQRKASLLDGGTRTRKGMRIETHT